MAFAFSYLPVDDATAESGTREYLQPMAAAFAPCPLSDSRSQAWTALGAGALTDWLSANGVNKDFLEINERNLVPFALELVKFPSSLRSEVVARGGQIQLLEGSGVSEDPTWRQELRNTLDGRSWSLVPGAGGFPYLHLPMRIVVNRIYDNNGSINMVLHEYAHTLDSTVRHRAISTSVNWSRIWVQNQNFILAMRHHCGAYCTDIPEEGFAETLALFYSCKTNQDYISRQFPQIAAFILQLERVGLRWLE